MKKNNKNIFDVGKTLPSKTSGEHSSVAAAKMPSAPLYDDKGKPKWRKIVTRVLVGTLLVVLAVVITIGVWDWINLSRATQKTFGSGNALGLLNSSSLKGSSSGRVNVLLVGYSVDDPGHAGANLTDTIVLLSLSTNGGNSYMLSIPRDLYTPIAGFYPAKINEAYKDGGMGLLEQTVTKDFGVPIDYWAIFDYTAVRDIVNAVGGINVTINSPDGKLYDPNKDWTTGGPLVDLTNGTHHLNGQQALDFSRARGDPSQYGTPIGFEQSDFQRTADQRLVIAAIKAKLNWKLALNPLKNGKIFSAVGQNVKTDINIHEVRPLFGLLVKIPENQLKSYSLRDLAGKNYLVSSYYEGDTLSPAAGPYDFSQIQSAVNQLNQ